MEGKAQMSVETAPMEPGSTAWHAGLTRSHWRILGGSYLGWLFDGYETFALVIVLPAALATLLTAEQAGASAIYAGLAIGMTLVPHFLTRFGVCLFRGFEAMTWQCQHLLLRQIAYHNILRS